MQYVGETILPLHKRMNIHRKSKSGCELMIEHFSCVCTNSSFTVQVIEKLDGNGYSKGSRDKEMYAKRLSREDFWIKTLRTMYPYGLNEKTKEASYGLPVGTLFQSPPRYGTRQHIQVRTRTGGNTYSTIKDFLDDIFSKPIEERANFCRKILESLSLKNLKKMANEADIALNYNCDVTLVRWYKLVVDNFFIQKTKAKEDKRKRCRRYGSRWFLTIRVSI